MSQNTSIANHRVIMAWLPTKLAKAQSTVPHHVCSHVFLNICSSCSHFNSCLKKLSALCLWTPSPLVSCLLAPLLNSGCVVTCLSRFAIWSPASFGSWDSGLRVAGRGSLCGWSLVGWLLSRRSLGRRLSFQQACGLEYLQQLSPNFCRPS